MILKIRLHDILLTEVHLNSRRKNEKLENLNMGTGVSVTVTDTIFVSNKNLDIGCTPKK